MEDAPERIWIDKTYGQHPEDWNFTDGQHLTKAQLRKKVGYIRADLVEAAIKRALEAAANMIRDGMDDSEWYNPVRAIRALDPAQFIEEEKG
jgi:hypothetical protein